MRPPDVHVLSHCVAGEALALVYLSEASCFFTGSPLPKTVQFPSGMEGRECNRGHKPVVKYQCQLHLPREKVGRCLISVQEQARSARTC